MPGNLPVPNTIEVKLHWGGGTVEVGQNVLHFVNTGAVVVNQGLADALDSTIKGILSTSGLAAFIHSTLGIRQVGVRNLALANQAEFLGSGAVAVGTATGDALPTGIAQCYTLRTALAGKSFRGRVYLSYFAEGGSVGSTQDAAAGAAGTVFLNSIRTSLLSAPNLTQCIVSRFSNGAERPTPIVTPVTATQLRHTTWNTQRRRMSPGGSGVIALQAMTQLPVVPASQFAQFVL